ncbi:hypothetical protein C9374_012020 [Naegleria lovaniensis]|uniref:Tubulin-specific chaperone D n=1 Tax=Naegleria lovaniensis TaxID=51637 RepID=A0AA88GDG5_NAELO|nr:uncharacterized protein C9374_012020 [Naegleria lovaniensis]KAG2373557.1 hypothetical protein C9374_012020 [Naegleria lovaniensis]
MMMMDTTQDNHEMVNDGYSQGGDAMQQEDADNNCYQTFFAEHTELSELIQQYEVKECYENIQQTGTAINRILSKYMEQSQLLDPHLTQMVSELMRIARRVIGLNSEKITFDITFQEKQIRHNLFQSICTLTKVRGQKVVTKLFPHEIVDLEPLFEIYKTIPANEWETKYILLLWLSMIVINPFDLTVVDPTNQLPTRMLEECKAQLSEPGKTRDSASLLISRLLTRPDMATEHLPDFVQWGIETLSNPKTTTFLRAGILRSIVMIFKIGKRDELLNIIPIVWSSVISEADTNNTMLRHLNVKLIQRIGLTFLKPRVVAWRYHTTRLTLMHLKNQATQQTSSNEDTSDEEIEIPEEIEQIISHLINGLRDKDTIVRWSTAKGIGRITLRLPKYLGDQIVESVCELMNPNEDDSSWHGASLALAELARRGLLLPERLEQVIPLLEQALVYDVRKGTHSVGAHVRDAACYVCWAFARAYAPDIMKPYMNRLAQGLVKIAVFDREVNCRRAAAAAFQENVGRQGSFPHGIDIITVADYFSLCNRTNSYLTISHYIAQYPEYCQSLISYLVDTKVTHWEKSIRELASKTIAKLCDRDSTFIFNNIIPILIDRCVENDLNARHGSLLALSEVILALKKSGISFDENLQEKIRHIVPNIEAKRLYRGKGGEIMREAVSRFIECMALSHITLPATMVVTSSVGNRQLKKKSLSIFQETIDENLKHPNNEIIEMAVKSLKAFAAEYYEAHSEFAQETAKKYIQQLETEVNPATRRGLALALGVLPKQVMEPNFNRAIDILISKLELEQDPDLQDADARRNAILGIISLCENVGIGEHGITESNVNKIFNAFIKGTNDYAVDKRGDVGSWVREASMSALERWAYLLANSTLFSVEMGTNLMRALLKQAVEKIDRVRDNASKTICRILSNELVQNIPHKHELVSVIVQHNTTERNELMDWSSAEKSFPIFVKLLDLDIYRYSILSGLVVSMGGMSSHVFKYSTTALIEHLKPQKELGEKVFSDMLSVGLEYAQDDRVIVPLLKSFALLLGHGVFEKFQPPQYNMSEQLVLNTTKEITGTCKNVQKIMLAVDLFCELIKFENPTKEKAFQRLFHTCLMSKFPKVREYTANQLYGALQVCGDTVMSNDEALDMALDVLCSTQWLEGIAVVKPAVEKLYEVTQIPKPKTATTASTTPTTTTVKQ